MERQRIHWWGTMPTKPMRAMWLEGNEIPEPRSDLLAVLAITYPRDGETIEQCERDEVRRSWPSL